MKMQLLQVSFIRHIRPFVPFRRAFVTNFPGNARLGYDAGQSRIRVRVKANHADGIEACLGQQIFDLVSSVNRGTKISLALAR